MSLMVSNIRLPFDVPEEQALAEARRLTGLASDEVQAAVHRVSIDARRGKIFRVYSVRLTRLRTKRHCRKTANALRAL